MKKVVYFGSIAILTLFSVSCSKKKGCTDPTSINYDSKAEENDNSCAYEGNIIFYYDQSVSEELVNSEVPNLTYYVDNKLVGSSASSVYFTSKPNCGAQGSMTVKKSLGTSKNQSFTYSVKGNDNEEIWGGTVIVNANDCTILQLTESNAK